MSIDAIVLTNSFLGMVIFFAGQMAVFRKIDKRLVLSALAGLYFFTAVVISIISAILFSRYFSADLLTCAAVIFFVLLLFTLQLVIYVIGIFGCIASSVRIELLLVIANSGAKGKSRQELIKKYSRKILINRRLHRLTSSGEIAYSNGKYSIQKHVSPLFFTA